MNFEDELHNSLHRSGATIDVKDAGVAALERKAKSRAARRRAGAGLGAFALVAAAVGGTYAMTRNDSDQIQVAAADQEDVDSSRLTDTSSPGSTDGESAATDEAVAESSSRPAVIAGEVNYGVVPLTWGVVTAPPSIETHEIAIAGNVAYARTFNGWLASSTDLITWTDLPAPEIVAGVSTGQAWVNGFDATGDVVVASLSVFDDSVGFDIPAAGSDGAEAEPFVDFDPCSNNFSQQSYLVVSSDRGQTWTTIDIDPGASPEGRFHRDSSVSSVATDGTSVIASHEQYTNVNIDCILSDAGISVDELYQANSGYGWSDTGVQIYSYGDNEEEIIREIPWSELGLNDAELAAVTNNFEMEEGAELLRITLDGTVTPVDVNGMFFGELWSSDGEYGLTTFEDVGQAVLRSSDGGLTWTAEELSGYVRSGPGNLLIRDGEGSGNTSISTDGGRTWTEVGTPPGTWIQNVAYLDGVTVAVGEQSISYEDEFGSEDFGPVEPFDVSASLDGYTITVGFDPEGLRTTFTLVDNESGALLVEESIAAPQAEGSDSELDVGWLVIRDGMVTFYDGDIEIVSFLESDIEAAFEEAQGSDRGGASTGPPDLTDTETSTAFTTTTGPPPPTPVPNPVPTTGLPQGDGEVLVPVPTTFECTESGGVNCILEQFGEECIDTGDGVVCTSSGSGGFEGDYIRPDMLISYRGADGVWISQSVSDIVPGGGYAQTVVAFNGAFYVFVSGGGFGEPLIREEEGSDENVAFDQDIAGFGTTRILIGRP